MDMQEIKKIKIETFKKMKKCHQNLKTKLEKQNIEKAKALPHYDKDNEQKMMIAHKKSQKHIKSLKHISSISKFDDRKDFNRLIVMNLQTGVADEIASMDEMEKAMHHQNVNRLKQALNANAYNEPIFHQLTDENIQNEILAGNLDERQIVSDEVREFFGLLKTENISENREIDIFELLNAIGMTNENIASSPSGRTHAMHKIWSK